jgi:hypothetical protein
MRLACVAVGVLVATVGYLPPGLHLDHNVITIAAAAGNSGSGQGVSGHPQKNGIVKGSPKPNATISGSQSRGKR